MKNSSFSTARDAYRDVSWSRPYVGKRGHGVGASRDGRKLWGHNIMCANRSIVDGNHDPKAGYGTARAPCLPGRRTRFSGVR